MITVILLVLLALVIGTMWAQEKFHIVQRDNDGQLVKVNYKPIVFAVAGFFLFFFSLMK